MINALEKKRKRQKELEGFLADSEILKDRALYQRYAKELSSMSAILAK